MMGGFSPPPAGFVTPLKKRVEQTKSAGTAVNIIVECYSRAILSKASRGKRGPLGYFLIFYSLYNYYIKMDGGYARESSGFYRFTAISMRHFHNIQKGPAFHNHAENRPLI